jgi:hypothetical protein
MPPVVHSRTRSTPRTVNSGHHNKPEALATRELVFPSPSPTKKSKSNQNSDNSENNVIKRELVQNAALTSSASHSHCHHLVDRTIVMLLTVTLSWALSKVLR